MAGAIEMSRRWRVITTAEREREHHDHGEHETEPLRAARPTDHEADSDQGDRHRHDRAAGDRLAKRDPGDQRGRDRRRGLHEEHVGDGRVVERDDEAARGEGRQGGDGERGSPHRREGGNDMPALHGGDEDQEREGGEDRAARDLGGRVDLELALEHASRRPRERGEHDVDLAAAAAGAGSEERPRAH